MALPSIEYPPDCFASISRRSPVFATRAAVASSQPLASQAGLRILMKGGNAADAAVAVAAALNVTEPCSTGIGGDCFCLFYDAKSRHVYGLNGSGRAPAALTLDFVRNMLKVQGDSIPHTNINSVTVPGAAAGWVDTVEWFGSGRLSLGEILEPAIELAEGGYPVSPITAHAWGREEKKLKEASPNSEEMLVDGRAPQTGEVIRLPNLAETFRVLAREKKDGFYRGRIAQEIVNVIQSRGGVMTLEDLASHTSTRVDPIRIDFGGVTVYECPPNGQGLTALMALGILEALDKEERINLKALEHNSVEYLHAVIEALRIAFIDARWYVSDPDHGPVPVENLLHKDYLAERSKLFDPERASVDVERGKPLAQPGTVYFSVVDEEGNACSFINSNYQGFGSGAIPKGCGFTLQNRGSGFNLTEGSPNCIAPRKRPYHTIIPAMVTVEGELFLCYGVMGKFMQPQGHVQVLLNLLNYKMDPQTALDRPRFCIGVEEDGVIYLEDGIKEEVVRGLEAKGHRVRVVTGMKRDVFGKGQIIRCSRDARTGRRVLTAGSDQRGDGQAIGY
ncbi:uncharacterized protein VTP21DRAFT_11288 [Calcarisporiella thermophila]|uniref:uncharacterized protein n=1 Tax=Calcarisporiella thermophila TaxID=911321 RepID=UPI0037435D6A